MIKRFSYMMVLAIVIPYHLFSQGQQVGSRVDKLVKVIPPSPEAASLGKYGEVPVGLFTGLPQISIPLYSVKEGSIDLPVTLSYHSGGVRVSELASSTGLGWSLNAGGVITRSVRGKPDEDNNGYFYRDARIAPLTIPIPGSLTAAQYTSLENVAYNNVDMDPDIFNYNFLGRSGKFFFDHNRNIRLMSPEDIKISVTPDLSVWTIKDDNGNTYTFSVTEQTSSTTNQDTQPELFISSWFLTNIVTREGRQIDFYYSAPVALLQDQLLSESDKYQPIPEHVGENCYSCPDYNGQIQRVISRQEIYSRKLQRIETAAATIYFVRSAASREDLYGDNALTDVNILSKVSNAYVKKYHLNYSYFIGTGGAGYGPSPGGDGNKRLKLLSVEDITDPGQGALHKFYYDETLLPSRDSYAQDHWGFYNGATFNTTLLPQIEGLPYGIPYGNRSSNATYATAGVLNKIEYPTGGSTTFTYEPNQSLVQEIIHNPMNVQVTMTNQPGGTESTQSFTIAEAQMTTVFYQVTLGNYPMENISPQMIVTDQNNNEVIHMYGAGNQTFPFYFQPGQYLLKMISPDIPESNLHGEISYKSGPITQTVNKIVGGVRVKQTADFDPVAGKSIIKKYEYPATAMLTGPRTNEDYQGTSKEMAPFVCDNPPPAHLQNEYKCHYITRSSASKYSFGDISGSHIAYPTAKVIYGQNGENGYSESVFQYTPAIDGGGFPYAPAMTYDSRNGLLLTQKDYNAAGVLVKQTTNNYQFDEKYNELSTKIGFAYDHPYRDASSQGQYYDEISNVNFNITCEHVKKISTSVVQYDPSGANPVSSITSYFYDNAQLLQPTREETVDSKNNLVRTQSTYPNDYPGNPVYTEMLNRNILTPVEQTQTNVTLNKQLSKVKTNYQFYQANTQILPVTIESSVLGAALQTDVTVNAYDDKGNIQEYNAKDGVTNAIIWGYNKQYAVAKVTGSTYANAIAASGINMAIVNSPVDENSLRTELNKLRTLPGTLVSTLTYKPLVGVSSETDARGYTKYYEYDAQGRLSVIRDAQNNILKKICYNYAGQPEACPLTPNPVYYFNVQLSQVFTRNNCPAGQTPGQVTYTVAANTYSSTISQADANQQAQNEINANGQAYANANGSCTAYTCNGTNCTGVDKKCINGVCETGVRINKTSTLFKGVWTCTYVYRWSDCSESQAYSQTGSTACTIGPLCGN